MIKKTLAVLLIEDSTEYAELVQRWLSDHDDREFVLSWTDSLAAGLDRLQRGDIDVILLDLGLPDSAGFETFARVKDRVEAVPIILLSSADSEALALRMIQAGAQDYLFKSTCTAEALTKAIQYAVLRSAARPGNGADARLDATRAIGIVGAKGGTGATTVACNLAVAVRELTGEPTLLADLDLDRGLIGFLFNADCDYSILDAAANLHRLDAACWDSLISQGDGGLHILRSPELHGFAEPDRERIHQALTLVRSSYRWIIFDFGRLTSWVPAFLEREDELLLVTNDTIPALHHVKRAITALATAGLDPARLRLIVNRMAPSSELSPIELHRLFGAEVYADLPKSDRDLHAACCSGKLPAENTPYRAEIARLARKIAGRPDIAPRSTMASLFSIAGKLGLAKRAS